MSNPAGGYTNAHERFAVRISNNGEFIHANPASSGAQGNTNVTNGCINLSTSDAQQYFNSAIYGDPVEVTGTSHRAVLRRRRHLGLGRQLGRVGGDVGAVAAEFAERDPQHRSGHAVGCASRPSSTPATMAVEPGYLFSLRRVKLPGRAGLVARPDHDQVQVDVRRAGRDEPDHLGDVLGDQRE